VAANGRRCTERAFLELHHIHPHALDGPATVANISLRCRRHNAYEAELVFGPGAASCAKQASGMARDGGQQALSHVMAAKNTVVTMP
jgi:hypothetical protein